MLLLITPTNMLYFNGNVFIEITLIEEYDFDVNLYKTSDQWHLFAPSDSYKIVNNIPEDLVEYYKMYKQEHSWRQPYAPKPKSVLYNDNFIKVMVSHKLMLKKYVNSLLTETCRLAILGPSQFTVALSYDICHWDSMKIQLPTSILPLDEKKLNKYLNSHTPHTQEFIADILKKRSIYPYSMDDYEYSRIQIANGNADHIPSAHVILCIFKLITDNNLHEVFTIIDVDLNYQRQLRSSDHYSENHINYQIPHMYDTIYDFRVYNATYASMHINNVEIKMIETAVGNPYFTLDFSINNPILLLKCGLCSIHIVTDGDSLTYSASMVSVGLHKAYLHCDYALYNHGKKYQQVNGFFYEVSEN
jgi:hypothetical protein